VPGVGGPLREPGAAGLLRGRLVLGVREWVTAVLPRRGYVQHISLARWADVALVAPTAMLVVRKDFHPALVPLLLTTASRIHGTSSGRGNGNTRRTAVSWQSTTQQIRPPGTRTRAHSDQTLSSSSKNSS